MRSGRSEEAGILNQVAVPARDRLQEAEKWANMVQDRDLRDAGLIASAQRVEHYEIAVYGSLATWAKQLGLEDDLQALLAILEEEKRTDERLSMLAKRMINPDAAAT